MAKANVKQKRQARIGVREWSAIKAQGVCLGAYKGLDLLTKLCLFDA
jgi:hypothetical protein